MANGPQLTTVPYSDKRYVHTSRQDRLLCLTLIVFSLSVPKQQEVHPHSSERTGDSRVSRLKDVLQLPDGPKQGKQARPTRQKVAIAARELCFDRSRPTIPLNGNVSKSYRFKLRLWTSEHDIFPIPLYFIQPGAEECVFGSRRKLKVSVLSANFQKYRFCNYSGSYTKHCPSEYWSWTKTHSVIVTEVSWVHFNPRKTKIGQKKSLTPFFHRDLQLYETKHGGENNFCSSLIHFLGLSDFASCDAICK